MEKRIAKFMFMYHYTTAKNLCELMREADLECQRNIRENGSSEEFEALIKRIDYYLERSDYHLAKCDEYKAIINA